MSIQIDNNNTRYAQAAAEILRRHENGEPEGSRGDGHLMPAKVEVPRRLHLVTVVRLSGAIRGSSTV